MFSYVSVYLLNYYFTVYKRLGIPTLLPYPVRSDQDYSLYFTKKKTGS